MDRWWSRSSLPLPPRRWPQPDPDSSAVRCFGPFRFDPVRRELFKNDSKIELTNQAAVLLALLTAHPGLVVTRDAISNALWGEAPPAHRDAGINNLVSRLRGILEDDSAQPSLLRNFPREGYLLDAVISFERRGTRRAPVLTAALAAAAAGATAIALLTQAVGAAAILYAIFFGLLVAGFEHIHDSALVRGGCAFVLFAGMAYIPSAWTLFDLSGEVVNFDTLRPAALYPFVTGMNFLPLFALALMTWVFSAPRQPPARQFAPSKRSFWAVAVLFVVVTAIALSVYSGDVRMWKAGIPGASALSLWYGLALVINVLCAVLAFDALHKGGGRRSQRLLGVCGIAYLALLVPAVAIGDTYNAVNRNHLDLRRPEVYRASNPDGALHFLRSRSWTGRSDVGPDLRALLAHPEFRQVLSNERLYRVDFDERFQIAERAVMFGYRRPSSPNGRLPFRMVRLPLDVAQALGLERAHE